MPREATGTAVWKNGRWQALITIPGEGRKLVAIPVDIPKNDREWAMRETRALSQLARKERYATRPAHAVAGASETVAEYAKRWIASRKAAGIESVSTNESHLRTHILPALGPKPVRLVTREDIELFVERSID